MSYWMTQSLLSSWRYYMDAEDAWAEAAYQSFLSTLRREKTEPSKAMRDGILFENLVNDLTAGKEIDPPNGKWDAAARRFAKLCAGGRQQVPLTGQLHAAGMDFTLYGVCDYVKAGRIYDIKKVSRYEYGKYAGSPQHPIYLYLLPEAARFDYLIFDGSSCYRETYRRCDCRTPEEIISGFVRWLAGSGHLEDYKSHWAMNEHREEMLHDVYKCGSEYRPDAQGRV